MNWVSIGSGNGLSPIRHQAITWTNAVLLSTGLLGTNFSEIWVRILSFSFNKMHFKISSARMAAIYLSSITKVNFVVSLQLDLHIKTHLSMVVFRYSMGQSVYMYKNSGNVVDEILMLCFVFWFKLHWRWWPLLTHICVTRQQWFIDGGFPHKRPVMWSFVVFYLLGWTNCYTNSRYATWYETLMRGRWNANAKHNIHDSAYCFGNHGLGASVMNALSSKLAAYMLRP